MSNQIKHEITPLFLLAIVLLLLSFVGCASTPVIDAVHQTDTILNGDIFKPDHVVTIEDKQQLKSVLTTDKAAIQQEQKTAIQAEKKAESFSKWAHVGYVAAGVLILICIGVVTRLIIKGLRFFGVL